MNGFWFGVAVGAGASTALFVFIPKIYDEVKAAVLHFVHKDPPAPPAPPVTK